MEVRLSNMTAAKGSEHQESYIRGPIIDFMCSYWGCRKDLFGPQGHGQDGEYILLCLWKPLIKRVP
jgi:hypothetical protein